MNKKVHYCVLGLGITGISCLKFLIKNKNAKVTATDDLDNVELQAIASQYPQVEFFLGELKIPDDVDFLVLSPGIDQSLPKIQKAISSGAKLTNDINLFLEQINIIKQHRSVQLVAITGTNGKTTVVNILASMAKQAGIKYSMCGNVGNPVLDSLQHVDLCLYILELSSFQLELVAELNCDVACVLNITPDHLDRHANFSEYCAIKLKIYQHAKNIVYYREDLNTYKDLDNNKNSISFGLSLPIREQDFGIDPGYAWIIKGKNHILPINELALTEEHNVLNSLACLAIGDLLSIPQSAMKHTLRHFSGLDHRYQKIGIFNDGIIWINDSKGTNIGATIVALNNTGSSEQKNTKRTIIILGGINKNADLSILIPFVVKYCKSAILIGECKNKLLDILKDNVNCYVAIDLPSAVNIAKQIAICGDTVLFSPACASFDMFKNYKHRGEVFTKCVLELYSDEQTT